MSIEVFDIELSISTEEQVFTFRNNEELDSQLVGFGWNLSEKIETLERVSDNLEIAFEFGSDSARDLFENFNVSIENLEEFLTACETWTYEDVLTLRLAFAVGLCPKLNKGLVTLAMDYREADSWRDLAMQLVDDGLFGEIDNALEGYLDYTKLGRDLAHDYEEIELDGKTYFVRVG